MGRVSKDTRYDEALAPESLRPRTSRRALMTGMAVGVAGLVADGIVTAQPAGATSEPVLLGQDNPYATATELSNTNASTATAALQCDDVGGGIGPAIVAKLTNPANASAAIEASAAGTGSEVQST
jgi:hypothetical protein